MGMAKPHQKKEQCSPTLRRSPTRPLDVVHYAKSDSSFQSSH